MVAVRMHEQVEHLSLEEFEARVRAGRIPSDAEVHFPPITGDEWARAGDLEMVRDLLHQLDQRAATQLPDEAPPLLTALLIGLNIRVWWAGNALDSGQSISAFLTNWTAPILLDGESWRLWTMGFAHTALTHIASNLIWFVMAAALLERVLGRANLLMLYMGSVLAGAIASAWFAPFQPSLGASGGVFGLIGALTVFGMRHGHLLTRRQRQFFGWAMVPYVLMMLWSGTQSANTDNWAHFVGFGGGAILCFMLSPFDPEHNRRVRRGVWAASALVLALPWLLGPRVYPLMDSRASVRAAAAIDRPDIPPFEAPKGLLSFDVPAGWRAEMSPAGVAGFAAPSRVRGEIVAGIAVREAEGEIAGSPEALYDAFVSKLKRGWPALEAPPTTPTRIAGQPALTARLELGGEVVLHWVGATRGLQSLELQWWVDPVREAHLDPLYERLAATVAWELPWELADAERGVERTPSPSSRRRLAWELTRVGEYDRAEQLLEVVLADTTASAEARAAAWQVRIQLARARGQDLDVDAVLRDATPDLVLSVAEALSDRPQVRKGLLDLAGTRWPAHKALRKERLREGLPARRDGTSRLPWHVVFHTDGTPRDPDEVAALTARPLDIASAAAAGEWLESLDEEAITAALTDGTRRLEALAYLKYRYVPEDLAAAHEGVARDLGRIADGRAAPAWVPTRIAEAASDPMFIADIQQPH